MPNENPNWSNDARDDLTAILDYISADNPDAAERLIDRIEAQVNHLPDLPLAHRTGRLPGTREMVVHPHYLVVYRATETGITILRILHSARNWP